VTIATGHLSPSGLTGLNIVFDSNEDQTTNAPQATKPVRSATSGGTYRPGDLVFFSIDRVSGEAMVIGYDAKHADTLIVAVGLQFTEIAVASCFPTGQGEPPLGESTRRHYMKLHPGKIK
jgi:hypothetical protein